MMIQLIYYIIRRKAKGRFWRFPCRSSARSGSPGNVPTASLANSSG